MNPFSMFAGKACLALAGLLLTTSVMAAPVMRMSMTLIGYSQEFRLDRDGFPTTPYARYFSLTSRNLANLALGRHPAAVLPAGVTLGFTCEAVPRLVVFNTRASGAFPLVGELASIGSVNYSNVIFYTSNFLADIFSARLFLSPLGNAAHGLDGGELLIRGLESFSASASDPTPACPTILHFQQMLGEIGYHYTQGDTLITRPAVILRSGSASARRPVVGETEGGECPCCGCEQ